MKPPIETELKFLVPQAARANVVAELERGSASLDRSTLVALYLDTPDRSVARAGLAWRLRREGRRWIQTLKSAGPNALHRFEHEAIRPDATPDASEHAGTAEGERLIGLLRRARAEGQEPAVRFRTEVRRLVRRVRTRGAVVEVAFDEGRILTEAASLRLREVEFELVSGSPTAMLGLAERWRKRFGLLYEPRSKSERGDRLADGLPHPAVRKAVRPDFANGATAAQAFGATLDECLTQIGRNAIGLTEGDPAQRVEHVHQLRVGIRRLRSALRSFKGWVPSPPDDLVAGLRSLFAALGMARDGDVLASGVMAELAQAGAPPLVMPAGPAGPDPAALMRAPDTQRTLLAWITWRASLVVSAAPPATAPAEPAAAHEPSTAALALADAQPDPASPEPSGQAPADAPPPEVPLDARSFRRQASRRLKRWHQRIVADWKGFDGLDDEGLHELRKRIKRQRYAVEFFSPLLRRRDVDHYLEALAAIQDRMGSLNDLYVARARYQAMNSTDPAAWFALGWLAARTAELRALAKPELARLAKADPPSA